MIPVLFVVTILVFSIIRFIPGEPARLILGEKATEEAVAALTDCACVVLCHGAGWDAGALQRAGEQGVALYTCPLPEFEAAYLAAAKLGLPLPQA